MSKEAECFIHFSPEGNSLESWEQNIMNQGVKNGNHFIISGKTFVTVNVIMSR